MNKQWIMFINAADTSRHNESGTVKQIPNYAIYPNLGLLTLMSSLKDHLDGDSCSLGYFDGTVYGNETLQDFIDAHAGQIQALCFSVLTANYGSSIAMAERAKALNPKILNVFGNDHFSAKYRDVMDRRPGVDYGFFGNDVVTGFARFMKDWVGARGRPLALQSYPGLVYRDESGQVSRNPEDSAEMALLPPVDYRLMDSFLPHSERYLRGQQNTYFFMREKALRSQVIDIGRGCIKFAGERFQEIPVNACDFCGIIPGSQAIASPTAERAWATIRNAFEQGYNYLYVTADELPLTLWPLLREMAASVPEWFARIPRRDRPRFFGYARAEAFALKPERIETLINVLGFDHFFIGFDGLSDLSLRVMNKEPVGGKAHGSLMSHNLEALERVAGRGCMITAGLVLTHLGITPEIMETNFRALTEILERYAKTFAALDVGPLCPIPGSQSFTYLTQPDLAEKKAAAFGLRIDKEYLHSTREKYQSNDLLNVDELVRDFILGCCPDISVEMLSDYMERTTTLAARYNIVIGGAV